MFHKFKKRAAGDAAAASTLILIIGFLIVLYILFLPPEDRPDLLDNGGDVEGESESEYLVLLSESPERLIPAEKQEFEKYFSAVTIYLGEEGVRIKEKNNLYTKRALFSDEPVNLSFNILNLDDIKSSLLNFYVEEGQGRLMINLNGKEVFNKEIEKGNINPISIEDRLVQGENILIFKVSNPGALFWRTNEYSLEDILITADVFRTDTQESTQIFVVNEVEKESMEKVKLRYLPECVEGKLGPLSVSVNGYNLFSAVPADCGTYAMPLEFLPDKLIVGENRLKFSTTSGWYLIDNIKISSDLKEAVIPTYYFELENEEYNDVQNGWANITFYMRFVDDVSEKVADITINNHIMRLDQEEVDFNETINKWVEKGNNAIKIEVEDILDIVELKIIFES